MSEYKYDCICPACARVGLIAKDAPGLDDLMLAKNYAEPDGSCVMPGDQAKCFACNKLGFPFPRLGWIYKERTG